MVLHRTRPFWALMDHSGTEPGTETFNCNSWSSSASLKWIGLSGVPSSTCAWSGGTTSNYRGASNATSTTYGSLNTTEAMNANSAAVEITMAQPVTLTSFVVVVDVGWDHIEHTGTWNWNILVDGAVIGSTCETRGVSQPASTKLQTCLPLPAYLQHMLKRDLRFHKIILERNLLFCDQAMMTLLGP